MTVHTLPRPGSFRDQIAGVLRDTEADPAGIADRLHELHDAQMRPLLARVADRELESSRLAVHAQRGHHVLLQAENLAAHQTQALSRTRATMAHQGEVLRKIRGLAQGAFDGNVKAEDLAALLTEEIQLPTLTEIALGFYPTTEFRGGQFVSHDGAIRIVYAFVGWTNVARLAGGPIQAQPTFLVPDRGAVPSGVIEVERNLRLELPLLPHVKAV